MWSSLVLADSSFAGSTVVVLLACLNLGSAGMTPLLLWDDNKNNIIGGGVVVDERFVSVCRGRGRL